MASLSDLTAGGGSSQPDAAATLLGKFHSRQGHYEYVPSTPLAPGKYVVKSSYAQRGALEVHANTGVQKYSRGDNTITFDLTASTSRLNMTHSSWEYDVEQQRKDFNLRNYLQTRNTETGTANPYWLAYANNRMMASNPDGSVLIAVQGVRGQIQRSLDRGLTWQNIATPDALFNTANSWYEAWTVEWNNGRFIISAGIAETWNPLISYDGFTWTQLPNMPHYNSHPLNNAVRAATTNAAGTTTVWLRQTTNSTVNMVYSTDGVNFFYVPQSNLLGNPLQIYHDGTQFIATDDGNRLVFSADGISWSAAVTNAFSIRSMTKLGSFYYVVTTAGVIYRSTTVNGTWTLLTTLSTSAQTNHQLLTVGSTLVYFDPVNTNVRTSTDGVTWSIKYNSIAIDAYNTIAKGGDYVFIHGNQNFRSTDGINWNTKSFLPVNNQYATAYGAGLYVSVGTSGQIYTSPDLNEYWTQRTSNTAATLTNVHYANGLFVAVGTSGVVVTSPDGISWAVRTTSVSGNTIWGLDYQNSLWVLCSEGGFINTSTDGINWTQRASGTGQALRNVAYGNGIWMVVGDSATVLTSTTGVGWTNYQWSGVGSSNFATSQYVGQVQLFGVAYGAGRWVVGGASSYVLTSTDNGASWTTVKRTNFFPENGAMPTNSTIAYIRYVNGLFVAQSNNGNVFSSVDGIAWRPRASSVVNLTGKHFNYINGAYVFTQTNSNRLGYTTDLDNWNWQLNIAPSTIYGVAFNPNTKKYVITAGEGIFETTDFRTWSKYQPNNFNGIALYEIVYANNIFVSRSSQSGQMYWSEDGFAWFPATAINYSDTYSNNIIYEDGSFWKVWNGKIQRSLDGKVWNDFYHFPWNEYQPRYIKKVDGYYVVFGDNRYATYQTYWINKNMLTEPKQWTPQYLGTTIASGYIIDIDGIDGVYVFCFAGQNTAVASTLYSQRSGNNNSYGYFLYNTESVVGQVSGRKAWVVGKDLFISDGAIWKVVKSMPSSTNTSPTSNIARASLTGIAQNQSYYPTKWGGHVYVQTGANVYDFDATVETTFSLYNSTLVNVN